MAGTLDKNENNTYKLALETKNRTEFAYILWETQIILPEVAHFYLGKKSAPECDKKICPNLKTPAFRM